MKRVTRLSYMIKIVVRLLVIMGLMSTPTSGFGQEQATIQPETQPEMFYPTLVSSAWLRVGPSAQHYDLHQSLAVGAAHLDQTFQTDELLETAFTLESTEQEIGVNSQVAFIVWQILRRQNDIRLSSNDLRTIVTIMDTIELEHAWGNGVKTVRASDGLEVNLPQDLNSASIAVLSALIAYTPGSVAVDKLDSLAWYYEFRTAFQQYFGDPLSTPDQVSAEITSSFRLPFSGSNRFNGGPHGGSSTAACTFLGTVTDGSGLDFHAPRVLAVAKGKILALQNDNLWYYIGKSVAVLHETNDGKVVTMYWHLASVNPKLTKDMEVPQGMYIGDQGTGAPGSGFGAHLHVELRTYNPSHDYLSYAKSGSPIGWDSKPLDSYLISRITNRDNQILNYQGTAVTSGPTSKELKDSSVVCGKNQQIHAIVSTQYTRDVAVNDFAHTKFADPYSSSELSSSNTECETNCGTTNPPTPIPAPPNQPPRTPSPSSPADHHVQNNGRAPTLCWNNPGDPDGDGVNFYAEVYDSARNANSGWISNACWRPGELDGDYHNYQWRVKAKDSRGAESGWSSTWHFRIEPENLPPTISFNTANGNSSGEIASRDQTWTFQGTASDPEGPLREIKFHCHGDACNEDPTIGVSGNWSYQRNGLSGRNEVWFTACDDRQCSDSRRVILKIDLAAPTTTADADGQINPTDWFRGPVNVTMRAQDGATGGAAVGVREIRYRINGGGWQTHGGDNKVVPVSGDGQHTVDYYAVDHLDNQEGVKSIRFKIDATPPTPPSGASEIHGVASDQWQKTQGTPEFTWAASNDSTSGLQHYELYFGEDANGADIQKFVAAGDFRRWTPLPGGVRTGTYYLRARSRDNAGNYSAWVTLFVFRYDVTPPANPTSASHSGGLSNNTWQRQSNLANFTWPAASDEGAGVKGYLVYWGSDADGASTDLRTATSYQSATPLCATSAVCTGYLRLRSEDNVGNRANDWSSVFTLRYDGAPPTLDFSFNNGVTQTAQTLVTLNLNGADQGSGLHTMRFSNDGVAWTPWETYATERLWQIPAIGGQSWPVYAQVRDAVGNESPAVMHEVYFEVNRAQPRSVSYRMFDSAMSAGAGSHTSPSFKGRSTVGEVVEPARVASASFRLVGGYQAGSRAIPLVVPGHDDFTFINGVFASGIVNSTMKSGSFQMVATVGETALPNNVTTIASSSYRHQPGFLAARPWSGATPEPPPTPTPIPGPTPTPEPTPACEFPTVSIDDAAIFTNSPNVTIKLCAPRAVEMKLSNDGGFGGAAWQPYATSKAWTLTTFGQYVLPRYVYAAFKDSQGNIFSTYLDDIIYDPTEPTGQVAIGDPASGQLSVQAAGLAEVQSTAALDSFSVGGVTYVQRLGEQTLAEPAALVSAAADGLDVYLIAQDDNSGLAKMQLSESADFSGAAWQPYDGLVDWAPAGGDGRKTLYARFRDSAGNVSDAFDASFVLDTQAPIGGIALADQVVRPDSVMTTVYLGAEDNVSGVAAMRLSEDPTFAGAPWQSYANSVVWPLGLAEGEQSGALHVQFRDLAGNVSQTYSDAFLVDREPPVVYMEVEPADTPQRTIHIYAYDGLSALQTLRLTNDPIFIQGVTTMPYTETVQWTVDERRVVWAQVIDGAGNVSEPYPAYAANLNETPAPTGTPTNTPVPGESPTPGKTPTPDQSPTPGETLIPGGGGYQIYLPSVQGGNPANAAGQGDGQGDGALPVEATPNPEVAPTPLPPEPSATSQPPAAADGAGSQQIFVPIVADGGER